MRTRDLVPHQCDLRPCTRTPVLQGGESCCLVSVPAGDGGLEMDILDDLESLKFEYGIPEDERYWLYLQGRYRGLMIKGCAHAVFFCKLFCTLR